MIEWLKTSILGLIILGAIGSILAVSILKLSAIVIRRIFKPAFTSTVAQIFVLFRASHYVIKYLRNSDDIRELIATCTFLISGLVIFAAMAAAGFIIFAVGAATYSTRSGTEISAILVVAGTFMTFTSGFFMVNAFLDVKSIYYTFMRQADEKAELDAKTEFIQRR